MSRLCLLVCLLAFASIWSHGKCSGRSARKCTQTPPLCAGVFSTNLTRMPNFFKHSAVEDAALEMNQFFPLIKIQCSSVLREFLCSLYTPPCERKRIPPCRSVCESARNGCLPIMKQFGFAWPQGLNCNKYPPSGKLCRNFGVETPTTTQYPTTAKPYWIHATSRPYWYRQTSRPYWYRQTSRPYWYRQTSRPYWYRQTSRPYWYRQTSRPYWYRQTSRPYWYRQTSRPYWYRQTSRPYWYRATERTYSYEATAKPYWYGKTSDVYFSARPTSFPNMQCSSRDFFNIKQYINRSSINYGCKTKLMNRLKGQPDNREQRWEVINRLRSIDRIVGRMSYQLEFLKNRDDARKTIQRIRRLLRY